MAAAVFALLGAAVLIASASVQGKPWHIVSFSVYGASLVFLFLFSALHHGIDGGERVDRTLRTLDYVGVFLLIAGTFTPISLILLRGVLGWSLFGVAWVVALTGIVLRAAHPSLPKWITSTLYITMGWLAVAAAIPLYARLPAPGFALIVLGGVFYSAGFVIYVTERPNPRPGVFGFHELWHVMVILGAASHYAAMAGWVLAAA